MNQAECLQIQIVVQPSPQATVCRKYAMVQQGKLLSEAKT